MIRKYYGRKLSTWPVSIFEEVKNKAILHWLVDDVTNYFNYKKKQKEKFYTETGSPKVADALLNSNPTCTNVFCGKKI